MRASIGRSLPPFAPPWPIYPTTVFSGSGVLASIHVGGGGDIDLDGRTGYQNVRVQNKDLLDFFREMGKHFLDSDLKVTFRLRSQNLHPIFFDHIIDRLFEP